MADRRIPLSALIRNPVVRDAFIRAERAFFAAPSHLPSARPRWSLQPLPMTRSSA